MICSLEFAIKLLYHIANLSMSKGSLYLKAEGGAFKMTAHDAILRLVDLLMLEKDKNTQLQLELQQEKQKQDEQSNKD